jgi:hypothetical protein
LYSKARREALGLLVPTKDPADTWQPEAKRWLLLPERLPASSSFSGLVKPVGNESGNLLGKENHPYDYNQRGPKQHTAEQSTPDGALLGTMLLPESDTKQCNGKTQKPGTQRREENARGTGSQSGSESEWKATTDRRDGTQDRHQ